MSILLDIKLIPSTDLINDHVNSGPFLCTWNIN